MTDGNSESNAPLDSILSKRNHEQSLPKAAPRQKMTGLANGLQSSENISLSHGNFVKELTTEEAELASVIARVTGRVKPFERESSKGEGKFTILCGEADFQNGSQQDKKTESLCSGSIDNENNIVSLHGIEFTKASVDSLLDLPVSISDLNENVIFKPDTASSDQDLVKSKETVECMKDITVYDTQPEGYPYLCNHVNDMDHPFMGKELQFTKSSIVVGNVFHRQEGHISKQAVLHDEDNKINAFNGKAPEITATECEDQESTLPIKLQNLDSPSVHTNTSGLKSSLIIPSNALLPNELISRDETEAHKLETEEPKQVETKIPKEEEPEVPNETVTSLPKEEKVHTIKAYFPSVIPKVPAKTFVMDSPEIQQNILNRRAAARNATSIAEFEPLVNVSPEAEKLAMWKRSDVSEKNPLSSPELEDSTWSPSALSDYPSDGIKGSPGSKDTASCIPKDLRKQILNSKSTEKNNKNEEERTGDTINRRDSERGNNGSGRDPKLTADVPHRPWLVPFLLVILIPVAITLIVLLVQFKPWMSLEPISNENYGNVNSLKDNVQEANPKALQQIIEELQDMKRLQEDSLDVTINAAVDSHLADFNNEENNRLHYSESDDFEATDNQDRINEQNLITVLTNKDVRVTDPSPTLPPGICGSFETLDSVELCTKIKPAALKFILKYIIQCKKSKDVIISDYLKLYRYVNSFLSNFGGFAIVQTKMLEDRIQQLEDLTIGEYKLEYEKLSHMILFEISIGTIGQTEPFSGSVIFTCLHRHLQFLTKALKNILNLHVRDTLGAAFDPAYEEILAIHHSWFVKIIYEVGMNSMITLEQAVALLSIRQVESFTLEELLQSLKSIIEELESLNQGIEEILIQSNALDLVPKEVIT